MTAALKAEFKKLLTVRSTYIASGLALLFIIFMAFYVEGYRGLVDSASGQLAFKNIVFNTAGVAAQIIAIIAALFMAHEYRYNTINYTLTASNSRTKVLLAKLLTISAYAATFTLICALVGIVAYYGGLALRGAELPAQSFDTLSVMARTVFYGVGYGLAALMLTVLLRNVVLPLAIIFMAPATVEPLLGLVLKDNAAYLPFAALQKLVLVDPDHNPFVRGELSPGKAALVFTAYLIVGWLIAWAVFLRRDAN